jgi:hypothetical protein
MVRVSWELNCIFLQGMAYNSGMFLSSLGGKHSFDDANGWEIISIPFFTA